MAQAKKGLRKEFFDVSAPFTSAKISLYGNSMEELNGRVVTLDLTRNLRGKSLVMKLRAEYDGKMLVGNPLNIELAGSYIRRMIRKGTDYVEDSFETECKDIKARIKPFMITRNKVSRAVRNKLRVAARQFLESYSRTRTSKEVFADLMSNKIQKELSLKLKKIYPLALCEVRVFAIIEERKSDKKA